MAEEDWYGGKLLIYGHTPMQSVAYSNGDREHAIIPMGKSIALPETGSICLDTGCVFNNALSALVIKESVITVEAVSYVG